MKEPNVTQVELMRLHDRLVEGAMNIGSKKLYLAILAILELIKSYGPSPDYSQWLKQAASIEFIPRLKPLEEDDKCSPTKQNN